MRVTKLIIWLVFVALVTGCNAHSPKLPESFSEASMPPDHGVVVGSFTRDTEGGIYTVYRFKFREIRDRKNTETWISVGTDTGISGIQFPKDIVDENTEGALFFYQLPAGEYEFHNYEIILAGGYSTSTWTAKEPYSIPFEIQAGKVSYLGEIKSRGLKGKNLLGMSVSAGIVFNILDNEARDTGMLRQKYPDYNWDSVVNSVPKEGVGTEGSVYFGKMPELK